MSNSKKCTSLVDGRRRCKKRVKGQLVCCGTHLRTYLRQIGGSILPDNILNKIVSIGYEFETPELSPIEFNDTKQRWEPSKGRIPIESPNMEQFTNASASLNIDTIQMNEKTSLTQLDDYYHKVRDNLVVSTRVRDPKPMLFTAPDKMQDIAQYFCNTEFHFTYKALTPTHTAVKDTLNHAISELKIFFSKSKLQLASYGTSKEPQAKVIRLVVLEDIPWLRFIATEPIASVSEGAYFFTQMTVGIALENIIDVITYLAKDTDDHKDILRIGKIVGLISQNSRQLSGWLFLLLLNMLPKDNSQKFDYSFSLRHPLNEIFNYLSQKDQADGKKILLSLKNDSAYEKHVKTHNQYGNIKGLITQIIDEGHDPLEKTRTKRYPYDNKAVLIEIRTFPLLLSKLFGSTQKGLTLEQLTNITQRHM